MEKQMGFRGKVSSKQELLKIMERTFDVARSQKDFFKRLKKQNIQFYKRGGNIYGIKISVKLRFRLRTLGYTPEILKLLDRDISREKRIEELRRVQNQQKNRSKDKER